MATTKTETKEVKEEVRMVKIKIPLTRKEKDDVWVAVNGQKFLIKRGEEVEVPEYVAEVLQRREEMLDIAMAYEEAASANAGANELK